MSAQTSRVIVILLIAAFGASGFLLGKANRNGDIQYFEGLSQSLVDYRDTRKLMGVTSHVFVGEVVAYKGTVKLNSFPESQFFVNVQEQLKGQAPNQIVVVQVGGYDADENSILVMDQDPLLVPGATYLFATRIGLGERVGRQWYRNIPKYGDVLILDPAHRRVLLEQFNEAIANEIPFDG